MSEIKSKLGLFAMMIVTDSNLICNSEQRKRLGFTKEEKEDVKALREINRIYRLKQKGVKEYYYGNNVILARNKKNADIKARNKGYLNK